MKKIIIIVFCFVSIHTAPSSLRAATEVTHTEVSVAGHKDTKIIWETQNPLQYQLRINRHCEPFTNGTQAQPGRQEIILHASELTAGKNEIRICTDDRGSKGEILVAVYREDAVPVTHALPEPADWNGDDPIILHCEKCEAIYFNLTGEQKYAGPIRLPPEGGSIKYYSVSAAGVRSDPRSLTYDRKESSRAWRSGRLHLSPLFMATTGAMRDVLANGWAGLLSYEQGPDGILTAARQWYVPGLRAEIGAFYLSQSGARQWLVPLNVGPIWEIAPFDRHSGRFFAAGMVGLTYISAVAGSFGKSAVTSNVQLIGGYRLPWDNFALRLAGRYLIFFDTSTSLTGLGAEIGVEYKIL